MTENNYDTVSEAISDLAKRGYTYDFSLADGEDCIICHKHEISLSPDDFIIDEVHRFEGQTDPGDEMILYAIASNKLNIKGIVLNAFGMYAESLTAALIEKLVLKTKVSTSPIKRSKALVQFSREHHFGLLLVWKIRQGLKNNIALERISNYTLFSYDNELAAHFKEEEKDLFVKLPAQDELRKQAFAEHEQIYKLVASIREEKTSSNLLSTFADSLDKHIRFEERILFNHLQKNLSIEEIKKLEENHSARDEKVDDQWEDQFWITK
ncbi:MAG: hemerythrin domain-containing protein [bacterium]|nr:hemerythrin domain-containing protein [bacterium]